MTNSTFIALNFAISTMYLVLFGLGTTILLRKCKKTLCCTMIFILTLLNLDFIPTFLNTGVLQYRDLSLAETKGAPPPYINIKPYMLALNPWFDII